jgi:hypothetical protein
MSCIRFSTSAQRAQIQRDAPAIEAADAAVLHLAPPVTDSKLARLRLLAQHTSPGIRQSVASNRHAPADLLAALAADPEAAVRGEVARNETSPAELVERLAQDRDARVRCWAVLNPGLPGSAVPALLADADPQVRRLAGWRREHVAV